MGNSSEPVKMMEFLNISQEKLLQAIPGSLKSFPWKKLETFALRKFLVLGKESLKWSLLALYALSFVSDIVYSISQNKELAIPFGLFAGYVIACYIDDISRELSKDREVGHLTPQFLGICFFALVKIVAVFIFRGKDVILHVANGGLMQVLWNLRRL
ncbi:hypothetical protein M569_04711 [Genlisea aurea]|uniref:Uncharacterized protein n=1 Tax=Genlisea aurea TaxID=192259 RepID=S8EBV7_9LAMI|nr:hypothetical protein M569_04711 [Genlisea aurea]